VISRSGVCRLFTRKEGGRPPGHRVHFFTRGDHNCCGENFLVLLTSTGKTKDNIIGR